MTENSKHVDRIVDRLRETQVLNGGYQRQTERNGMETEIREEEHKKKGWRRVCVAVDAHVGQHVIKSRKLSRRLHLSVQEEAPDGGHDTGWIFNGRKHSGA